MCHTSEPVWTSLLSNRDPDYRCEDGGCDAHASDHQTADLPLGALKISFGSKMAVSTLELIDLRLYIQNPLIHRSHLRVTPRLLVDCAR